VDVLIDGNIDHLRKVDVIRVSTAGVMTPYKIQAATAGAGAFARACADPRSNVKKLSLVSDSANISRPARI
jgi:hypothetical protein